MNDRIKEELELLRRSYSNIEYSDVGQWVKISDYPIPAGGLWNRQTTDACFQIPLGYPVTPPYGFYVTSGILCGGNPPNSYQEPAQNSPPFQGTWGFFSWQQDSSWLPKADLRTGSNLLNFVKTFRDRFMEGR
jgi:hypothetical protein